MFVIHLLTSYLRSPPKYPLITDDAETNTIAGAKTFKTSDVSLTSSTCIAIQSENTYSNMLKISPKACKKCECYFKYPMCRFSIPYRNSLRY